LFYVRRMKQFTLACLLLTVLTVANAQKERIRFRADSMVSVSLSQPNDTLQSIRYCDISNHYQQLDPEQAVKWARQGIQLSDSLHFLRGSRCAYNNLGMALYMQGKYADAIAAFRSFTDVCFEMGDSVNMAWGYNNMGNVYIDLTDYKTTILYYDTAFRIRKQLNDSLAIAQSLTNFGYIYKELGNYTLALIHLYQALAILEPKEEETSLAYCYDFIGSVYALRKQYAYSNTFYRKALSLYVKNNQRSGEAIALNSIGTNEYALGHTHLGKQHLQKAYAIYQELKDTRQLAIITSTLSEIYTQENKPDSALLLAQKSIRYHLANQNTRQLGSAYLKLAKAYDQLKRPPEAIKAAEQAFSLTTQSGERNNRKEIARTLSELYAKKGNFAQAYHYQLIFEQLKDSILNEAGERAIADMQTKYETEKKDIEIDKQATEIRNKQIQLIWAAVLIVVIIIIFILLYNRYRLKQQNILNQTLLTEQSLRNKAIIEAEEKERIRIARELHDGIGQQLSATKMNMSVFEASVPEKDKETFRTLIQLVDDTVKEVRSVSHNLIPNALIRSGLSSAVRDFVHNINNTDQLRVDLQIVGLNTRLEKTMEAILYRVLQESINNIIKHAQASQINIQLVQHPTYLNMLIEDNGIGFDTRLINQHEGIGLKNMTSRIQFLNGTIAFDSMPGKGTTVIIDIPLI
jgi:two-component system NarL family sensor kinase